MERHNSYMKNWPNWSLFLSRTLRYKSLKHKITEAYKGLTYFTTSFQLAFTSISYYQTASHVAFVIKLVSFSIFAFPSTRETAFGKDREEFLLWGFLVKFPDIQAYKNLIKQLWQTYKATKKAQKCKTNPEFAIAQCNNNSEIMHEFFIIN